MEDLKSLYLRIENPIDNKVKWNKLLNIYSTSYDYEDFYSNLTKKDFALLCGLFGKRRY